MLSEALRACSWLGRRLLSLRAGSVFLAGLALVALGVWLGAGEFPAGGAVAAAGLAVLLALLAALGASYFRVRFAEALAAVRAADATARAELQSRQEELALQVRELRSQQITGRRQDQTVVTELVLSLRSELAEMVSRASRAQQEAASAHQAAIRRLEEEQAQYGSRVAALREAGALTSDQLFTLRSTLTAMVARAEDSQRQMEAALRSAVARLEEAQAQQESETSLLKQEVESVHPELQRALEAQDQRLLTEQEMLQARLNELMNERIAAAREAMEARQRNDLTEVERRIEQAEGARERTLSALEARVKALQDQVERRMGPEFEERLEAWRARLDNEIGSMVEKGRIETRLEDAQREARLKADLQSVAEAVAVQRRQADELAASVAALREELANHAAALSTDSGAEAFQRALDLADDARRAGEEAIDELRARMDALTAAAEQTAAEQKGASATVDAIAGELKQINERSQAGALIMRRLTDSNAAVARPFDRMLSETMLLRFEQHWVKTLGLSMNRTSLAYLAHKICLIEDQGAGRIAAPIETILLRQLGLRSLASRGHLEVMEIGTLFGLGAAALHSLRGSRADGLSLTLIDPLEGYYEAGGGDPITGVEVCETVLRANMERVGVPEGDYRLLKGLSTDPQILKAASDRRYDFVLVDGDHSTAGVAADFENYGPLVKPGGLLLFDDYGSPDWPGIKPYVDQVARAHDDWTWIGGEFRTAILARKSEPPKRPGRAAARAAAD